MVRQHSIDGLRDLLNLWQLPEYKHWHAAEIVRVLITEVRILQLRGQPTGVVLHELPKQEDFLEIITRPAKGYYDSCPQSRAAI